MRYRKKNKPRSRASEAQGLGRLTKVPYYYPEATCKKCGIVFSIGHRACNCGKQTYCHAMPVIVGGYSFHSLSEARRFSKLAFLLSREIIQDLELQPKFIFEHNGSRICSYSADFRYKFHGKTMIEDVKGFRTATFNLKAKMFKAFYPDLELILVKV